MKIRYTGPFPHVDVPEAGLYGLARNAPVDVPDDIAAGLIESGVWSKAKAATEPVTGDSPVDPEPNTVPATSGKPKE